MSEKRPAPTGSAIIRLCAMVARVSYADDEDERVRESMIEAMLAARRELDAMLALSRRRCGCRHSKPLQEESDVFCHLWRIRQNPGGHCNEWAAKR